VPDAAAQLAFAREYASAWTSAVDSRAAGRDGESAPHVPSADELVREWATGWGLCSHLWNILWALTVAHGSTDGSAHGPEAATATSGGDARVDDAQPSEEDDEPQAKRAKAEPAVKAPAGEGAFDYANYAAARWQRYLIERASA